MKKVLVLSLVLIMALCGSALAAVNFSGEFETVVENDGKDFAEGYEIDHSLFLKIASSESDNWSLGVEFKPESLDIKNYEFKLHDDLFDLTFWNGKNTSWKGTSLNVIRANRAGGTGSLRLVVDAFDPVTLTTNFANTNNRHLFVDAKVADFDFGAAYHSKGTNFIDSDYHTVGVWGKAGIDMFTVTADAAATLPDADDTNSKLALAYGAKVEAKITDKVSAFVEYFNAADDFKSDQGLAAKTNRVKGGATYAESNFRVNGSVEQNFKDEVNNIAADVKYRMSTKLSNWDHLFHKDHWFKNDAPAFGASTKLADLGLGEIVLDATAPVMEDVVWVKGNVTYKGKNANDETDLTAEVRAHVVASDKLLLKPSVNYGTVGTVITVGSVAEYKIGTSSTQLNLDVNKTFAEDASKEKEVVKASVKVKF